MKRCRCLVIESFTMISFAAVALAFQTAVTRTSAPAQQFGDRESCLNGWLSARSRALFPYSNGGRHSGVVVMARSNRVKAAIARQRKLDKSNEPVVLSEKAKRKAKRERRAYFRERYACSGRRLIKLQQEDPDSFYIGFVGTNGAGRAQALVAVESYLKRATEFKVAKHFKGNAKIKLVDAGNMCLSEMRGKDERKLSLLRRCDLLVHVVRCFELFEPKPKPYMPWRGNGKEEDNAGGDRDEADEAPETLLWSNLGGELKQGDLNGEEIKKNIDWPLSPTPLEDVRRTRAEMAYADLQFLDERQKTNHTKWFWRNRSRALSEKAAIELVRPVLEEAYVKGGELAPVGIGFQRSCLRDDPVTHGTMIYRRAAIEEIGLLTPKPVVYVANVPIEAATSGESDNKDDDEPKAASESSEAIGKVALAHVDKVIGLRRDYGVPAVAGCLRNREGQDILGAAVFKAIPRSFLSGDPKLKRAANGAARKTQQRGHEGMRPDTVGAAAKASPRGAEDVALVEGAVAA